MNFLTKQTFSPSPKIKWSIEKCINVCVESFKTLNIYFYTYLYAPFDVCNWVKMSGLLRSSFRSLMGAEDGFISVSESQYFFFQQYLTRDVQVGDSQPITFAPDLSLCCSMSILPMSDNAILPHEY